jgi:hypothetical protein
MTIDNDALVRGVGFIPTESMRRYAGDYALKRALHKAHPDDFIVQEKQRGYLCTVSPNSDFPNQEELERQRPLRRLHAGHLQDDNLGRLQGRCSLAQC